MRSNAINNNSFELGAFIVSLIAFMISIWVFNTVSEDFRSGYVSAIICMFIFGAFFIGTFLVLILDLISFIKGIKKK